MSASTSASVCDVHTSSCAASCGAGADTSPTPADGAGAETSPSPCATTSPSWVWRAPRGWNGYSSSTATTSSWGWRRRGDRRGDGGRGMPEGAEGGGRGMPEGAEDEGADDGLARCCCCCCCCRRDGLGGGLRMTGDTTGAVRCRRIWQSFLKMNHNRSKTAWSGFNGNGHGCSPQSSSNGSLPGICHPRRAGMLESWRRGR